MDEGTGFAQAMQGALNLGAPAMDDYRMDTHEFEQDHVLRKRRL